ncbi:hypothetical protein HT031_000100 [Scenedesmus sp. PABB004]|nr:hypothetical protein HT031_000100 [Scenedesmus sp. PABB004]
MARLRRALVLALALVACRAAAAPPAVDVDPARHAAPGGPGAQLVTAAPPPASPPSRPICVGCSCAGPPTFAAPGNTTGGRWNCSAITAHGQFCTYACGPGNLPLALASRVQSDQPGDGAVLSGGIAVQCLNAVWDNTTMTRGICASNVCEGKPSRDLFVWASGDTYANVSTWDCAGDALVGQTCKGRCSAPGWRPTDEASRLTGEITVRCKPPNSQSFKGSWGMAGGGDYDPGVTGTRKYICQRERAPPPPRAAPLPAPPPPPPAARRRSGAHTARARGAPAAAGVRAATCPDPPRFYRTNPDARGAQLAPSPVDGLAWDRTCYNTAAVSAQEKKFDGTGLSGAEVPAAERGNPALGGPGLWAPYGRYVPRESLCTATCDRASGWVGDRGLGPELRSRPDVVDVRNADGSTTRVANPAFVEYEVNTIRFVCVKTWNDDPRFVSDHAARRRCWCCANAVALRPLPRRRRARCRADARTRGCSASLPPTVPGISWPSTCLSRASCLGQCDSSAFKAGTISATCFGGIWYKRTLDACAPPECSGLPQAVTGANRWPASCSGMRINSTCVTGCNATAGYAGRNLTATCAAGSEWRLPANASSLCKKGARRACPGRGVLPPPTAGPAARSCTPGTATWRAAAAAVAPAVDRCTSANLPKLPGLAWDSNCAAGIVPEDPRTWTCTGRCLSNYAGPPTTVRCEDDGWTAPAGGPCQPGFVCEPAAAHQDHWGNVSARPPWHLGHCDWHPVPPSPGFSGGPLTSVCSSGQWRAPTGDACTATTITPAANPDAAAAFINPNSSRCTFAIDPNQGERVLCVQGGSTTSLGNQFRIATLPVTANTSAVYRMLATDASILYTWAQLGLFFRTAAGDDTLHAVALVPVQVYGQRTSATRFCAFTPSPLAVSVPLADVLQALNRSMACSKALAVPVPVTALPPNATSGWTNDAATCAALQPDTARTSANVPAANITSGAGCAVPDGFSSCSVSEFSDWGPCTRLDITKWDQVNVWEQTRTRTVVRPGDNCPALTETQPCDAPRDPAPSSVGEMAKQALVAFIEAMPSAIVKTLQSRLPPEDPNRRRAALAALPAEKQADFAAGRRLWLKQADPWQKLWMRAFNGPASVLRRLKRNSPEVRAARAQAKAYAEVAVAQAYRDFNQQAISQAAVDASIAAQQTLAVGDGRAVASASARPQLDVPDLSALVRWNGGTSFWGEFGVGGLLDNELAAAATQYFIGDVYNTASWLRLVSAPRRAAPRRQGLPAAALRRAARRACRARPLAAGAAAPPQENIGAGVLSLGVAYDSAAKTAAFNAYAGNYLYLLALIRQEVVSTYGIALPDAPSPADAFSASVPTITTSVVVATEPAGRLESLTLALGGSWTTASLASKLGMEWGMADDLLTVSNPAVVYERSPLSLAVAMTVNIPALGVANTTTTLRVTPGNSVELLVHGAIRPFRQLVVTDVIFSLQKNPRALSANARGTLLGIDMGVAATIFRNKTVTLALTAERVSLGALLREIFSSDVPAPILSILDPVRFGNVSITYNSAAAKKFGLRATPDADGAPALKTILDFVGLSVSDVRFEVAGSAVAFGVTKASARRARAPRDGRARRGAARRGGRSAARRGAAGRLARSPTHARPAACLPQTWGVSLPTPFVGDSSVTLSLGVVSAPAPAFQLSGRFLTALRIPGVQGDIGIDISAGIAAGTSGVELSLSGATLSTITFIPAPFVRIGPLSLAASAAVAPALALTQFRLAGTLTIFGVSGRVFFDYDKNSRRVAFLGEVNNLDLQALLNDIGVDVELGVFNIALNAVRVTYSTVAIPDLNVTAGVTFYADITFIGLNAKINFALTDAGLELGAQFNTTELSRLVNRVLEKIEGGIRAAGEALTGAGSTLRGERDEAARSLAAARARVEVARADAAAKLRVFDDAKASARSGIASAQRDVDSAQAAFDRAVADTNAALEQARRDVASAEAAFERAKQDAATRLASAQSTLTQASSDFDKFQANALAEVNKLQAEVDRLWGLYSGENRKCSGWPDTWDHCAAAGGFWVAYAVRPAPRHAGAAAAPALRARAAAAPARARAYRPPPRRRCRRAAAAQAVYGSLEAARGVVSNVFDTAQGVAFTTAQSTLVAAQRTSDGLLTSTQAVALETARRALVVAQRAANGVLVGTQQVALNTARAALAAAQRTADGVLTGTQAAAWTTANQLLDTASGALVATELVSTSTLTAFSDALTAVGNALQSVRLSGFLQINGFGFQLTLLRTRIGLAGNYDITVAGSRLAGSFEFSLEFEDPLDAVADLLKDAAMSLFDFGDGAGARLARSVVLKGAAPTAPRLAGGSVQKAGLTQALAASRAVRAAAAAAGGAGAR